MGGGGRRGGRSRGGHRSHGHRSHARATHHRSRARATHHSRARRVHGHSRALQRRHQHHAVFGAHHGRSTWQRSHHHHHRHHHHRSSGNSYLSLAARTALTAPWIPWYFSPENGAPEPAPAPARRDEPRCARCTKSFGLFRWRWHCGGCGDSVCDACAQQRTPMPRLALPAEQRVCTQCASTAQEAWEAQERQSEPARVVASADKGAVACTACQAPFRLPPGNSPSVMCPACTQVQPRPAPVATMTCRKCATAFGVPPHTAQVGCPACGEPHDAPHTCTACGGSFALPAGKPDRVACPHCQAANDLLPQAVALPDLETAACWSCFSPFRHAPGASVVECPACKATVEVGEEPPPAYEVDDAGGEDEEEEGWEIVEGGAAPPGAGGGAGASQLFPGEAAAGAGAEASTPTEA